MDTFSQKFTDSLSTSYPSLKNISEQLDFQTLVSNHKLAVPNSLIQKISLGIKALFEFSHTPFYRSLIHSPEKAYLDFDVPNFSTLMAYDFHISDTEEAKLIEINTNAAGYLILNEAYKVKNLPPPIDLSPLESLKKSFLNESLIFQNKEPHLIAIIDENFEQQKMYPEFLMYKDFFQQQGWESYICDYRDLKYHPQSNELISISQNKKVDFIYNRYCDFLLQDSSSNDLFLAFKNKAACFSPNPIEYLLLADKTRMIDWSQNMDVIRKQISNDSFQHIQKIFIPTFDITTLGSKEEVWIKRKKLFFKPKRSHGGKATYKGKNISKKMFDMVYTHNFLAQETVPAPILKIDNQDWKYDLRFYVYKGEIQNICARTYIGQVTNFKTPGGGFTPIVVKN